MPLGTFLNGGSAIRLRGLQFLALSDFGQVGAGSATSDAGGGVTTAWTYGGTIPCRIDPILSRGDNEDIVAGRLSDQSTHVITVPAETPVSHKDRFKIANRGTFEVTAVRSRTAEWARFLEAAEVS